MAIEKAMVTGTAGIMDWFDRNATSPYYSVWVNRKQLLFSWNDDDSEAGRSKLETDLYAIEQNGVNDLLIVKLHPKKDKAGYITDKTPIYGSLVCRPSELEKVNYGMQQMGAVGYNSRMEETLNAILTKLNKDELEEEEEEEIEEDKGVLGNIFSSPQMQHLLISGLTTLMGSFAGIKPNENAAASMAGIDEDNANESIIILNNLMSKGVTLEHLRKLDEMGNVKLMSLLAML